MQLLRQWSPTSMRTRLTLWSVVVLALVLVLMGVILRYSVEANFQATIDRELLVWGRGTEGFVVRMIENPPPPPPVARRDTAAKAREKAKSSKKAGKDSDTKDLYFPRTFRLDGTPYMPGWDEPWDRAAAIAAAKGPHNYVTVENDDDPVRVLSMPIRSQGRIVAVLQTVHRLQEMRRDLASLSRTLLTLIPVALLIVGISAAFLMERMLRPVRQITHAAAQINSSDLSQRLPVIGGDEFSRLSTTFNAMLSRLEHSFDQQRRFTADASHELRTPLTAIRAHTSLALHTAETPEEFRCALEGANHAATLMSSIVQDLLLLARSDANQLPIQHGTVPVSEVLQSAVKTLAGPDKSEKCERPEVRIEPLSSDVPLAVSGDRNHLQRLFSNLLENAVRHTPAEGHVLLSAQREEDTVHVRVTDTGAGIAPEHLPHVCERFYRVDNARARKHGGTGLGLAICQTIVEAHTGRLTIESELGRGTTVHVYLPFAK
jgi:heavy metal sensor kinase